MLALHAVWTPDDALALWAEDSDLARKLSAEPTTHVHPFAASVVRLERALSELAPGVHAAVRPIRAAIPSAAERPCASPFLWFDEALQPDALRSWWVGALRLEAAAAYDWLLSLEEEPPRGLVYSDSLRCLTRLASLAAELCAAGQVVPTLERLGKGFVGGWRPRPGAASAAAARLREGMPGSLFALDDSAADAVFDRALATLVDAAAREALSAEGLSSRRASGTRTAAEAWLDALSGDRATLPALSGLSELAAAIDLWRAPLGADTGFRTCLRLAAPQAEAQAWRLEFLLQSNDDPSLLIPAEEVWRSGGPVLRVAGRSVRAPAEQLLGDLGRAIRLFPALEAGLRSPRPTGMPLEPAGAWRFLREGAPLLSAAGLGVLAPSWWGKPAARLSLRAKVRPEEEQVRGGLLGLKQLADFQWELSLGGKPLSLAELQRLAALKAPLVQLRGQWVELNPADVEAALAFLQKNPSGKRSAAELLRLSLGLDTLPGALPVEGIEATGWLGELLRRADDASLSPLAAPPGFVGALRPYQERGLGWLAFLDDLGLGACLADDMGLGKTIQVLALLAREGPGVGPTLLVCPMSLVGNWQREAARFAPALRVQVHHGATRSKEEKFSVKEFDLVLTTYGTLARDAELLARQPWRRVVLDEAQNVKNHVTAAARAARSLDAPRRIALTGTPVENRLSELWSILDFLNPGLLGGVEAFRKTFGVPIERYGDKEALERLKRATGPFVLRRLKTDRRIVPDLPDKFEMKLVCNLTREQATLYQAVVDEMLREAEAAAGIQRKGIILAGLTKLKQVCDHPALLLQDRSRLNDRSGKLARLEEVLEEALSEGDRALVFTQFAEFGHALRDHLQERLGREVLYLHGGSPRAARDAMVTRFAAPDGPPVFLLSLKAGGTGLNLVAANHVIHFDRWWNPAVEDQATDRAFRIGQTRDVQVRKLLCAGTLEERIDQLIEQKRALAESVVGEGEGWLSELSVERLRELVTLSADAVAEG